MSSKIICNTRNINAPLTGVQRYTQALLHRAPENVAKISPSRPLSGITGHLWEQCMLPLHAHHKILWSPANTGPLSVKNQVITIHDLSTIDHPEWFNYQFSNWYQFLLPKLVNRVAHIITISNFTKQRLIERYAVEEKRISVIYNGVDNSFTSQDSSVIENMRKQLSIPSKNYLLAIGSLEKRKNLERQLLAWRTIQNHVPEDLWLVLLGGGLQTSDIFRQIKLQGIPERVHIMGRVPEKLLSPLYAGALIFLYLSMYEGFGLPVLEAMASGTPVVTSNSSALPEVTRGSAISVDPYCEEEISSALLTLIHDESLRASLSIKGQSNVRNFSWDKSAKLTFELLKSLL